MPALTRDRHNLPTQVSSFIGRERELDEIARLLRAHRLITLTGSGGTGKTRLASGIPAQGCRRLFGRSSPAGGCRGQVDEALKGAGTWSAV